MSLSIIRVWNVQNVSQSGHMNCTPWERPRCDAELRVNTFWAILCLLFLCEI